MTDSHERQSVVAGVAVMATAANAALNAPTPTPPTGAASSTAERRPDMQARARMSDWRARTPARTCLASLTAAFAVLVSGCGEDSPDTGTSSGQSSAVGDGDGEGVAVDAPPGVPEECHEAYPFAMAAPDLRDVALLPSNWPKPPVDATLCVTSSTLGGGTESAEYVTGSSEQAVEAAYLEALAPFAATRGKDGLGDAVIQATVDGTYVEVQIDPGVFRLVLSDAQ